MWQYNYLCHFGILGQKKGVRRYQYKDGSLTPEGKIRYGVGSKDKGKDSNDVSNEQKKNISEGTNKGSDDLSQYSNEELVAMTERLRLENAYREQLPKISKMNENEINKNIEKGKTFIQKLDTAQKNMGTIANFLGNNIKAYNNIASISNTFFNTHMKTIKTVQDKKEDKKKDEKKEEKKDEKK